MSIAAQSIIANALESNALFVVLLFVIVYDLLKISAGKFSDTLRLTDKTEVSGKRFNSARRVSCFN